MWTNFCSTSLAIKKMQIKTILRFHLTPIIKKHHHQQTLVRIGEKGTLIHCWWECKLVQSLWETIWRHLKKLNIDLTCDPAIPPLGIYLKECDFGYSKGNCTPMLIAALFTMAKLWQQLRCPTTDVGLRKCGIYTQWNFIQPQRRMK
jgi:hypothetical protein